jgi:hypothetical protein
MRPYALLLLFLSAPPSQASVSRCVKHWAQVLGGQKVELVDGRVSVVHYPNNWHTEIVVDGVAYNPDGGFLTSRDFAVLQRAALAGHEAFIRYSLRVTSEEAQDIKRFIETSTNTRYNCVNGTCAAINKNTGIVIPFPLNQLASNNALYLALSKTLGLDFGRIEKIEYYGDRSALAGAIAPWLAETTLTSAAVFFVTLLTQTGYETFLVPLLVEDEEKTTEDS